MSERKPAMKSPGLGRKRFAASEKSRDKPGWTYLEAKFAFNYTNEQGRNVDIKCGDRYLLLKRTNAEWWHVLPFGLPDHLIGHDPSDVNEDVTVEHSFYIPAKYVKEVEIPMMGVAIPGRSADNSLDSRGHKRQGSTGTNSSATPDWKDDSGASNDGVEQPPNPLPYPVPQPRSRKVGDGPDTSPVVSATAEFKANLGEKISSWPRQDVGLEQSDEAEAGLGTADEVRVNKANSLPSSADPSAPASSRNGPPSPPPSGCKPVLLPLVPRNAPALRPVADRTEEAAPVDDEVIYANIPHAGAPRPPPLPLTDPPDNRQSTMGELPGMQNDVNTPSDRPRISAPVPSERGGTLQSVEKRGVVSKTKLFEYGKKVKKHWMQHHIALLGPTLYFYKDLKTAQRNGRAETTLDLVNVRLTDLEPGHTHRKNVLALEDRGAPGSSVVYLLEFPDPTRLMEWSLAIKFGKELAAGGGMQRPNDPPPGGPLSPKKHRASVRKKNDSGSQGLAGGVDMSGMASAERQTVIRMLRDFFRLRPGADALEAKGILRNEPVFGTTLQLLAEQERSDEPPAFVTRCIDAIEKRDGLLAQGVYRVNGNGATIQRLRCLVDQTTDYDLTSPRWDLEVLTGALKLFFRELKEPLIPCSAYHDFVKVTTVKDKNRIKTMKKLINHLPSHNHVTMKALFQHLHRVVNHSNVNQMHPRNLAIVFGPNLLWPAPTKQSGGQSNSEGLTASMMAQNQIVEFILNEVEEFFPTPPPLPQRAS